MTNLKKLSRSEMKTVAGGELGIYACCKWDGQCSATVFGDGNNLVCVDPGTKLTRKGIAESISTSLD